MAAANNTQPILSIDGLIHLESPLYKEPYYPTTRTSPDWQKPNDQESQLHALIAT